LPIGKDEILKTFKPERSKIFIPTGIAPTDGVIVVGDIDPAFAEKKVIAISESLRILLTARNVLQ
jgi:hypothetical protein